MASVDALEQPGDFCIYPEESTDGQYYIRLWLPGNTWPFTLPIYQKNAPPYLAWGWNGDREQPSLTPSIDALGSWHGYLSAGRFVSC